MEKLRNKTIEFLCSLEGYHECLKMIHWSTSNKSEHLLTDEIDGSVLEYEDKIAEVTMGCFGTRYGHGDLKCLLPNSKTTESLLKELKGDVLAFRAECDKEPKYSGIVNVLDDFVTDINKWDYLRTLK